MFLRQTAELIKRDKNRPLRRHIWTLFMAKPWPSCTFYEKGLLVVDIHETVGTGVAVASERVPDQFLPGWLSDRDVVVLHPATLMWVIDVSPVVACISLSLVDQHRMKPIWNLEQPEGSLKCWFTNGSFEVAFCIVNITDYRKVLLTCIIDLSEYISSMVRWILVILPCKSAMQWTGKSCWRNHNRD